MKSGLFAASAMALSWCATPLAAQVTPPPLEAYGELPAVEDVVISPTGKVAMVATTSGKRVLVVLDASLRPSKVVEIGDIKVRDIDWIGDQAIAVERSATVDLSTRYLADSTEMAGTIIVPAAETGATHNVFGGDRAMMDAVFGSFGYRQVDGRWVGLFAGLPLAIQPQGQYYYEGGNPALYQVDVETNRSRRVASAPLNAEYGDWLIDPAGEVAATLYFNDEADSWRILNDRNRELASGREPRGALTLSAFSADGTKVLYRVMPDRGKVRYYEVALAGGSPPVELWADHEVEYVLSDEATSRLIGYARGVASTEGGDVNDVDPVLFDAALQDKLAKVLEAFRPLGGELRDWTADFSKLIVETAGNHDSGTWFLVDTVAGKSQVIGKSRPRIGTSQVGPISTVHYKAQDGLEIEAVLTLPPGREARGLPLVVLPHGGPRAHDVATFDWWAQAFASRGYAVLQPNFRGSTDQDEDFMHAGDGQWGQKMQTDLSDGIAWLASQGTVDPTRACIVGASYGGYAALAGVTLQQDVYRCAVSVAGVTDLELFFSREYRESGRSDDLREGWLEMMGPRDQFGPVSPRRQAERADAPILLIHGRDDTVVPFEQSTRMAETLRAAGKPVELVELRGEDHWLSRSETRHQMLQSAVAFVQQHNPPN